MVGATAPAFQTMPLQAAMCCCVSQKEKIEKMFSIAEDFSKIEDVLIKKVFRNMDAIFPMGP